MSYKHADEVQQGNLMPEITFEQVTNARGADSRKLWLEFEKQLANDDGRAAKAHLEAGRPVFDCDPAHEGNIVRKWPDGHCELVSINDDGTVEVLRAI